MVTFLLKKSYRLKDLQEIDFKDLWGDHGIFTTMWIFGKPAKILFFENHIKNMIKSREGRIINISSISGLMGNPGQVNYSSSKAALNGFTKSLAIELGPDSIRVNAICPTFIQTPMTEPFLKDEDFKNFEKVLLSDILGRISNSVIEEYRLNMIVSSIWHKKRAS